MLKLYRHKLFIKDLKRINFTNTQYEKYINYLSRLINDDPLPPESRDHLLIGKSKGFREFHIGGDLVVIYKIKNEALNLVRIGSHSQLFE